MVMFVHSRNKFLELFRSFPFLIRLIFRTLKPIWTHDTRKYSNCTTYYYYRKESGYGASITHG